MKQPGFTYSACGPFSKNFKRIKKFRKTGNLKYLYRNVLDEPCFSHKVHYSDSKDLTKRIISDEILKDRAYEIVINGKYDGYQRALVSTVHNFFEIKTKWGTTSWRIT